jgi:hypothetical protein
MPNRDGTVKIDFELSTMFDFVLPDHYEGGSLSGNEVVKVSIDDGESQVFDPVESFCRKLSENMFDTEKSAGSRFDTTWNEPLGAVVEKKYTVGNEVLAKSELTSRMLSVLNNIREFCKGDEARQIERAIRCLDFSLFGELCEPVLSRMKEQIR